jgi:hypothetical protein
MATSTYSGPAALCALRTALANRRSQKRSA